MERTYEAVGDVCGRGSLGFDEVDVAVMRVCCVVVDAHDGNFVGHGFKKRRKIDSIRVVTHDDEIDGCVGKNVLIAADMFNARNEGEHGRKGLWRKYGNIFVRFYQNVEKTEG